MSNKFNAERTPSKSRLVYIDVEKFSLGVHIILQGGM